MLIELVLFNNKYGLFHKNFHIYILHDWQSPANGGSVCLVLPEAVDTFDGGGLNVVA